MTGELFELLSHSPTLGSCIQPSGSPWLLQAFADGVSEGARGGWAAIFQVRSRQLFGLHDAVSAGAFLSGLLIGAELGSANLHPEEQIVLAASGHLREAYAMAARHLALANFTALDPSLAEQAIVTGHRQILSVRKHSLPA